MNEYKIAILIGADLLLFTCLCVSLIGPNYLMFFVFVAIAAIGNFYMIRDIKADLAKENAKTTSKGINKNNSGNFTTMSSIIGEQFVDYINNHSAEKIGWIISNIMTNNGYKKINFTLIKNSFFNNKLTVIFNKIEKCSDKVKLDDLVKLIKKYIHKYIHNDKDNEELERKFLYILKEKYMDILKEVLDKNEYRFLSSNMNNLSSNDLPYNWHLIRMKLHDIYMCYLIKDVNGSEKKKCSAEVFNSNINLFKDTYKGKIKKEKDIVSWYINGLEFNIFSMVYRSSFQFEQALNKYNCWFDEIRPKLVDELEQNMMIVDENEDELEDDSFMSKYESIVSGEEFEVFLLELFEQLGYKCKHTGGTNDQGADLIISKNGKKTCVQAKFYSSQKLGNTPVQEVAAAVNYYKADNGIVVTNYEFTKGAYDLAKANNVKLIDGKELEKLIKKVDDIESIEF